MYISSSATLISCIFVNNNVLPSGAGGAVFCNNGAVNVVSSYFSGNSAYYGAALQLMGIILINKYHFIINTIAGCTANIYASNFMGNYVVLGGAAIYAQQYAIITISLSNFINNHGDNYGGAIYSYGSSYPILLEFDLKQVVQYFKSLLLISLAILLHMEELYSIYLHHYKYHLLFS